MSTLKVDGLVKKIRNDGPRKKNAWGKRQI